MTQQEQATEYVTCLNNPLYFLWHYVYIFDPHQTPAAWFPFQAWPAQREILTQLHAGENLLILKARQLGLTWLCLAYALWLMVFRPGTQLLVYSRSDTEAKELLSRLVKMYGRLPPFLQANQITADNAHEFELSNGSKARSFATTQDSGRSFTASFVLIDEADFIHFLRDLLNATLPTAEHGGQVILISTSDKKKPASQFKQMWREADAGIDKLFTAVFLPWSARPIRTDAWYAEKLASATTPEKLDDLHQEYPASPIEAMAGRKASKRFATDWLTQCFQPSTAVTDPHAPTIPNLTVYQLPQPNGRYLISVDTSEGNPNSDASPATVFDMDTWEEVAHLYGQFEPAILGDYVMQLGRYYQTAVLCIERNNHGHAVLLKIREAYPHQRIYRSPFDKKWGWLSSPKYKTLAVNKTAEILNAGDCTLHTQTTIFELGNIESATLAAPEGETDDRAMTIIIGLAALYWPSLVAETEAPRSYSLSFGG